MASVYGQTSRYWDVYVVLVMLIVRFSVSMLHMQSFWNSWDLPRDYALANQVVLFGDFPFVGPPFSVFFALPIFSPVYTYFTAGLLYVYNDLLMLQFANITLLFVCSLCLFFLIRRFVGPLPAVVGTTFFIFSSWVGVMAMYWSPSHIALAVCLAAWVAAVYLYDQGRSRIAAWCAVVGHALAVVLYPPFLFLVPGVAFCIYKFRLSIFGKNFTSYVSSAAVVWVFVILVGYASSLWWVISHPTAMSVFGGVDKKVYQEFARYFLFLPRIIVHFMHVLLPIASTDAQLLIGSTRSIQDTGAYNLVQKSALAVVGIVFAITLFSRGFRSRYHLSLFWCGVLMCSFFICYSAIPLSYVASWHFIPVALPLFAAFGIVCGYLIVYRKWWVRLIGVCVILFVLYFLNPNILYSGVMSGLNFARNSIFDKEFEQLIGSIERDIKLYNVSVKSVQVLRFDDEGNRRIDFASMVRLEQDYRVRLLAFVSGGLGLQLVGTPAVTYTIGSSGMGCRVSGVAIARTNLFVLCRSGI